MLIARPSLASPFTPPEPRQVHGLLPYGQWSYPVRDALHPHAPATQTYFAPGCFDGFLASVRRNVVSIPLLVEHDFGRVVAETRDGSLLLWADAMGLRFATARTRLPVDGLPRHCSAAFTVAEGRRTDSSGVVLCVAQHVLVAEVSLVADPAIPGAWARLLP